MGGGRRAWVTQLSWTEARKVCTQAPTGGLLLCLLAHFILPITELNPVPRMDAKPWHSRLSLYLQL